MTDYFDKKSLDEFATLARIEIPEHLKPSFSTDLDRILAYVEKLLELNVDKVQPLKHPVELPLKMRPDDVNSSGLGRTIVADSPNPTDDFFTIPPVID